MHRYDLLLQPEKPPAPFDVGGFERLMATRQLPRRADGAWVVRLCSVELELSALHEGPAVVAMQLRVPASERTDVLDAAIEWAVEVAGVLSLRVLDPQTNGWLISASPASREAFLRVARYAGEFLGVSEALGASSLVDQRAPDTSAGRVGLALVVFFAALFATFSLLTRG